MVHNIRHPYSTVGLVELIHSRDRVRWRPLNCSTKYYLCISIQLVTALFNASSIHGNESWRAVRQNECCTFDISWDINYVAESGRVCRVRAGNAVDVWQDRLDVYACLSMPQRVWVGVGGCVLREKSIAHVDGCRRRAVLIQLTDCTSNIIIGSTTTHHQWQPASLTRPHRNYALSKCTRHAEQAVFSTWIMRSFSYRNWTHIFADNR